jgi:hypothetical protein
VTYESFCAILNKHIFKDEKKGLLRRIAVNPERFIGLFRPTKPGAKLLQYLLQSHEILMGDALEEAIEEIFKSLLGFKILCKSKKSESGETLSLDQYFTNRNNQVFYFIEQKVRDDHDSTKKRGQISNFEKKLETLCKEHGTKKVVGIMYFMDPEFAKNKDYYLREFEKLEKKFFGVKLYLFYGKELFEHFKHPEIWSDILLWLKQWKDNLPEFPEINFDAKPEESFEEIKDLESKIWEKILTNDKLWDEGIIRALFQNGSTLKKLIPYFEQQGPHYHKLVRKLKERLNRYHEL